MPPNEDDVVAAVTPSETAKDTGRPPRPAANTSDGNRALSRRAILSGGALATAALADVLLADAPAADAIALPSNNAPPNTNTFYPEDYGAAGDGTTDDSTFIQACIDAAVAAGGSTVQFGPKPYLVNATPRTDRGGRAILALPNSATQATLTLQGVEGLTVITTTLTGLSYSSTTGCPSILGGPTPETLGSQGQFSNWTIRVSDLTILAPTNPSLCGLDLSRVVRADVVRVLVTTNSPALTQPSSKYTFGVRLPDGLNFGRITVDSVNATGYFTGFVCNTAHTHIRHAIAKWCRVGVGLTGAGQYDPPDVHASLFDGLGTEHCYVHIGGWQPLSGVISIPTGFPFYLIIQLWDIEDALAGNWYSTSYHLRDANNQIYGGADYIRVQANSGIVPGLLVSGGAHFLYEDLSVGLVNVAGVRRGARARRAKTRASSVKPRGYPRLSRKAWLARERRQARP